MLEDNAESTFEVTTLRVRDIFHAPVPQRAESAFIRHKHRPAPRFGAPETLDHG
jgi:hypothetical protein